MNKEVLKIEIITTLIDNELSFSEFFDFLSEDTLKDILDELDVNIDKTKIENQTIYF